MRSSKQPVQCLSLLLAVIPIPCLQLLCPLITGLDYETQKSYSLTFEAQDGGGRVSTANLFLEVEDVNDNAPVFEQKEYSRTVREGATSFQPQLFVRVSTHFNVSHLLVHYGIWLVSSFLTNHKINNDCGSCMNSNICNVRKFLIMMLSALNTDGILHVY
jgi:hypothetical protein